MECLEYSSPSWTRSTWANDQAVKWAKAKVCVYADSVLCVGQVKDISGATERWKGQVEDLKKWKNSPGFSSLSLLREIQNDLEPKNIKPEDFKDWTIFMTMFDDNAWTKNDENCISNADEVRNYAMKFLPGHWTFLGQWYGDSHDQKRTVELHRQQDGTPIQRDWSSCLQQYQCFESWNLEAKER